MNVWQIVVVIILILSTLSGFINDGKTRNNWNAESIVYSNALWGFLLFMGGFFE